LYEKSALAESDTVKTDAQSENKTAAPVAEKCVRGLGYPKGAVTKERSIAAEINFCEEHYMMSCCSKNETDKVHRRWQTSAMMDNDKCASLTRQVLCSWCDGDVGTGVKSSSGTIFICPDLCSMWYKQCKNEYFSNVGGQIVPCPSENSICSKLHNILNHHPEKERAVRFCSGAYRNDVPRFEVATGDRLGRCYDGVPAGKRLKQSKQQKFTQRSTRSRNFFEQVLYDANIVLQLVMKHAYFPMACITLLILTISVVLITT